MEGSYGMKGTKFSWLALLSVCFFCLSFFIALSFPAEGAALLEGAIVSVNPPGRVLVVRRDDGKSVPLALHPEAILFKGGARVSLAAFRPGERVVAVAGSSGQLPLIVLGLQDKESFDQTWSPSAPPPPIPPPPASSKTRQDQATGQLPYGIPATDAWQEINPQLKEQLVKAMAPNPVGPSSSYPGQGQSPSSLTSQPGNSPGTQQPGPPGPGGATFPTTAPQMAGASPEKSSLSFGEGEGRVKEVDLKGKSLVLEIRVVAPAGSTVMTRVTVTDRTKIYQFTNNTFVFLTLDQIKTGRTVRVSGFRQLDGSLDAMMILLMPEQ